ncbi:MAG: flagellar hook assembly protein FlgD [Hyphomicrobiales bacterium]|nr:MAG: flagellar hook assembly protein FlgD [Hyphomicrobiales bacterium]
MTISPVQSSTAATGSTLSKAATKASGDYNTYLQLLVTELKNQDPTKPVDPTQTVTQLATFSSLEQAVRTNDLLAALNQQGSFSQGAALIGRTVTAADGSVTGKVASVTLSETGLIVKLTDGGQLQLGPGVSIA